MSLVDKAHQKLSQSIYETHVMDRHFEAQKNYAHLYNLMNIGKGIAREDVVSLDYIQGAEKDLYAAIERREYLDSKFNSEIFEIKDYLKEILNYATEGLSKNPAFHKRQNDRKNVAEFLTVPERKTRKELEDELKQVKDANKKWESGWLSGESLQNKKYRKALEEVKELAIIEGSGSIYEFAKMVLEDSQDTIKV